MRILFLSDFCPWPLDNGYRLRIFHLIDALASRHDVTLASVVPDSTSGAFAPAAKCTRFVPLSDGDCAFRGTDRFERWAPLSKRVATLLTSFHPNVVARWRSPRILQTLKELAVGEPFDLVWTERVYIAELAREAGFRNIVVDLPDIESVAMARVLRNYPWYWSKPLHWLEWAKLFVYEQLMPYRFAGLTVCKEDDRTFFLTRRSRVTVVPNGVADFSPSSEPPLAAAPEMLFIGALNFESNVDAIRFFKTAVLPVVRKDHPNARLIAVGRDPIEPARALHDGSQCELVEHVDNLDPYFDRAAIFVAPIRLGSGTRLKVIEALARGKAVVATSVAAEGLDLRAGVDLEIADTPDQFAAACSRLLASRERRQALGTAGRARVMERYRWRTIASAVLSAAEASCSQSTENGARDGSARIVAARSTNGINRR